MELTLKYEYDWKFAGRVFMEENRVLPGYAEVTLNSEFLTPEHRSLWLADNGRPQSVIVAKLPGYNNYGDSFSINKSYVNWKADREYDTPMHVFNAWQAAYALAMLKAEEERVADLPRKQAREAQKAENRRREIEREAERAKRAEEREVQEAQEEAEKAAWIAAHGSDYLKLAYGASYGIQRKYVEERAAAEHPGYTADFAGKLRYDERVNPSEFALRTALAEGSTVVWGAVPVDDYFPEDSEILVIENFLGRYTLYKEI